MASSARLAAARYGVPLVRYDALDACAAAAGRPLPESARPARVGPRSSEGGRRPRELAARNIARIASEPHHRDGTYDVHLLPRRARGPRRCCWPSLVWPGAVVKCWRRATHLRERGDAAPTVHDELRRALIAAGQRPATRGAPACRSRATHAPYRAADRLRQPLTLGLPATCRRADRRDDAVRRPRPRYRSPRSRRPQRTRTRLVAGVAAPRRYRFPVRGAITLATFPARVAVLGAAGQELAPSRPRGARRRRPAVATSYGSTNDARQSLPTTNVA